MEKKGILKTYMFTHSLLSISHTKNHYSTSLIIILLLNKIYTKKKKIIFSAWIYMQKNLYMEQPFLKIFKIMK